MQDVQQVVRSLNLPAGYTVAFTGRAKTLQETGQNFLIAFGLAMNHPFVDGNKRIAHAAMAVFLDLNGFAVDASVDEQERVMLDLAAGNISREALTSWLVGHVMAR